MSDDDENHTLSSPALPSAETDSDLLSNSQRLYLTATMSGRIPIMRAIVLIGGVTALGYGVMAGP